MSTFYYSLLILLLWSSSAFAEPLKLIEEKLAIRLSTITTNNSQAENITGPDSAEKMTKERLSPLVKEEKPLALVLENRSISTEKLEHPFSVQVGSSQSAQRCYTVAVMLRKLGYPAFNSSLSLPGRGIWHRVYIGAFATRDSAQNVKDQLFREDITEGFIRHMPYAVQIGSSGSVMQLEALHEKLLSSSMLPYPTAIRNASSGQIEGRLLIGACYKREDCDLLLSETIASGYSAVIVER